MAIAKNKLGTPIAIYRHQAAHYFVLPDGLLDVASKIRLLRQWLRRSGVEFEEAWRRRIGVQLDDNFFVPFISREDLLVAKLAAGRAQDLIDVDALRQSDQSQEIEKQQRPASPVTGCSKRARSNSEGSRRGMVEAARAKGFISDP